MSGFLSHVYGQKKLKRELKRLLDASRIPHTMIFYGEEGLGKTTAALDLAALLTDSSVSFWEEVSAWKEYSDKVPVLTAARDSVWYIHPLGMELKIEQFRIFTEAISVFDGKPKVCIIDEAQTMMPVIANSLLKTLEEPIENVYFILITHDIHALLPTIRSRSESFPFFPLSREEYHDLMRSDPQKYKFTDALTEENVYQLSEGNPGITLEICGETENVQPERAMIFWETLTWDKAPFSVLSGWEMKDRKDFLRLLRWIILVGRDLLVISTMPELSMERCIQVFVRERKVAPYWSNGRAEKALTILETAETGCRRYISIKNIWDMILIELQHIQRGK